MFVEGEFVDVQGVSKGKGFQEGCETSRFWWCWSTTHGQHNRLRAPGSVELFLSI
jgi:large subunit ribosomal protein L3